MGKADAADTKREEKKAKKRAKKEAKKEVKRLKKEQKRREKESRPSQRKQDEVSSPTGTGMVNLLKESVGATKDSVFYKKRIEVSLSLLPAAMRNIRAALEDSVRSMILKHTDKVGVLMTFENIKVISNSGHGRILNELPFLHFKVAFDGLVFCPDVGCQVRNQQEKCQWS